MRKLTNCSNHIKLSQNKNNLIPGTYEVSFSGGGRTFNEIVKIVRIVDESVLLDLVADVNSDLSANDASGSDSKGGGGGCFIPSSSGDHSAYLKLGRIMIETSIILLGETDRSRRPQKELLLILKMPLLKTPPSS